MAMQLPHYLRAPEEWTPENVTAHDLVVWRDIVLSVLCEGCRLSKEMNVWRIGARLADDHLRKLRFRCRECGVYPTSLEISRRDSMAGQKLLLVPLRPRAWDDGHRADQARALRRAEERYKVRVERELKAWARADSATRRE